MAFRGVHILTGIGRSFLRNTSDSRQTVYALTSTQALRASSHCCPDSQTITVSLSCELHPFAKASGDDMITANKAITKDFIKTLLL